MTTFKIFLKEFTDPNKVRDTFCPLEDWEKICAYYSDADQLGKMKLQKVEAWLRDGSDEVLLARWMPK
jgi:hypothetical protein